MRGKLDGLDFEVAEVRHVLSTVADYHEFDLSDDEAVSTAMIAHMAVQVC